MSRTAGISGALPELDSQHPKGPGDMTQCDGLGGGIAARLAGLSLDGKGRLTKQLMAAAAVRCGLFVDLAAEGVLQNQEDSIVVEDRLTGFAPLDGLAAAIRTAPGRSLDDWMNDPLIGHQLVVPTLVELRCWQEQRGLFNRIRYSVLDQQQRESDLLLHPSLDGRSWTPGDAAVAILGAQANLVGGLRRRSLRFPPPDNSESVTEALGGLRWIVETAADYLERLRMRHSFTYQVLD